MRLYRLLSLFLALLALVVAACNMTTAASLSNQAATQTAAIVFVASATPTVTITRTQPPTPTATATATRVTSGGSAQLPPTSVPVINQPGGPPADVCSAHPASGTVNVRQGPALTQPVIALLQTHAQVVGSNGGWYQISFINGVGWVSGTVVALSGPCGMPQPETFCHFSPFGANGANIDLLTRPNGAFLTYADANADFIVTGESGSWVRLLYGATGQQGWILRDRGQLTGNCDSLDQVVFDDAPECRITATANTISYMQPYAEAPYFASFPATASVQATLRTADGWYGFDPGINWIPPDVTGIARLRWLPAGNGLGSELTTSAGCQQLALTTYTQPLMVCTLDMPTAIDFYARPGDSTPVGTLAPQTSVVVLARNTQGWMGFDRGDAPAGTLGLARLRWVPDTSGGYPSDCMGLPLIDFP